MKYTGLHLAALTSFHKIKEQGLPGWQVALPEEIGTVHCVRRYGAIAKIESPVFLEDPYNYQQALCGAKVKVILPSAFANADDEECARCEEQVRIDQFSGTSLFTSWGGVPWGSGNEKLLPGITRL